MESNNIDIGTRKVQYNNGAHILNIPNMAVRLLNIKAGDRMQWTLVKDGLQVRRIGAADEPTTTK